MKIAVINFSGNVGKSTVAHHLLAPRLHEAPVIAVESINAHDGRDAEALRGKQFSELLETLALLDDVVVDIGASNVEDFMNQMRLYRNSHDEFDVFVVPTVPMAKQQRDTIATIEALSTVGIEPDRIRPVFNLVDIGEQPQSLFKGIFEYHAQGRTFSLRPTAVLHVNELYPKLRAADLSIRAILADSTDYKRAIQAATNPAEKVRLAQQLGIRRLAHGVSEELDAVFDTLVS